MWSTTKSVALSRIATWIIIVLALVLAVALPFLYQTGLFPGRMVVPESVLQGYNDAFEVSSRESLELILGGMGFIQSEEGMIIQAAYAFWLIPLYYAFLVPALIILFTLDRLLMAIQRGEVFTERNVRKLRLISWGCFVAAFILALGVIPGAYFCFVLAILSVFFGIILRIVKNLFEAAVELKAENDFTI